MQNSFKIAVSNIIKTRDMIKMILCLYIWICSSTFLYHVCRLFYKITKKIMITIIYQNKKSIKIMIRKLFLLSEINTITRFCVLSSMIIIIIFWLLLIHIMFLLYNCFKVFSISHSAASELFKAVMSHNHFIIDDTEIDIIWLLTTELEELINSYEAVRMIRFWALLSEIKVSNKLIDDFEFKTNYEEKFLSRSDFKLIKNDIASE